MSDGVSAAMGGAGLRVTETTFEAPAGCFFVDTVSRRSDLLVCLGVAFTFGPALALVFVFVPVLAFDLVVTVAFVAVLVFAALFGLAFGFGFSAVADFDLVGVFALFFGVFFAAVFTFCFAFPFVLAAVLAADLALVSACALDLTFCLTTCFALALGFLPVAAFSFVFFDGDFLR